MKLICDFGDFQPWSGAVEVWKTIEDAGKLDELESVLEDAYPDGMTNTQLNDLLWFDSETVLEWLDMKEPDPWELDRTPEEEGKTLLEVPEAWLPYLINGDAGDMTEEELAACKELEDDYTVIGTAQCNNGELYTREFVRRPDYWEQPAKTAGIWVE